MNNLFLSIKYIYCIFQFGIIRIVLKHNRSSNFVGTLNKSLIIAPHPDDEVIGLGGYLLKTIQQGGKVQLIYLTDGDGSGVWPDREEIKHQRINLSDTVCRQLEIESVVRLHLPDGIVPRKGEDGFKEIVDQLTQLIDELKPDTVFATSATDYWPYDHVACSEMAVAAVQQSCTKPALWFYWVWAWYHLRLWQLHKLNFHNLYKVDISDQLNEKMKLMDMYLKPTTPFGKPWSGVLPKAMLYPFSKPIEIVEKYENLTQRR